MDPNMNKNQETNVSTAEKKCYTTEDLQRILGISRPTVYKLLEERVFSWVRIGGRQYRISRKSFDEWLDNQL